MSFVTIVRDYIDILQDSSLDSTMPIWEIFRETSIYILQIFTRIITYIVTFRWIHDFTLLPITFPQISTSILQEKLILGTTSNPLFSFIEVSPISTAGFFIGFFNSLFLSLPVSVVHILAIRRLYIQGIPAAAYSIGGYLIGNLFFIAFSIFGIRSIIQPWFSFEPYTYLLGLVLVFRMLYTTTQESLRPLQGWNRPEYATFFLFNFMLAWCEHTSIFQYLGNVNLQPTTSLLDLTTSESLSNNFIQHFGYIVGIFLGSIFWITLGGSLLLGIRFLIVKYTRVFLSRFVQTVNGASFILAIAFTLSSIPFYSADYLLAGPFGFVSRDTVLKNTVFSPYNTRDIVKALGKASQCSTVNMDISSFDRGRYLLVPENMFPFSFEDLNYRGEADWTARFDKISTVTDSRAGFLSLAKLGKREQSESIQDPNIGNMRFPIQSPKSTDVPSAFTTVRPRLEQWYIGGDGGEDQEDASATQTLFIDGQDLTFPFDFDRMDSVERGAVDFKIKHKYYSNKVYQKLLNLDIDTFLQRQPDSFSLSVDQELDIYNKQRILTAYYNSMRDYAQLPYVEEFQEFFDGAKSFSTKVYNQQFKGTLRSVSRLFALTQDPSCTTKNKQLILRYDQPLYTNRTDAQYKNPHIHEDILDSLTATTNKEQNKNNSPFLEEYISGPVYAGWNEKERRLVITNKFLPRSETGYQVNLSNKIHPEKNPSRIFKIENKNFFKIQFTSWPISNNYVKKSNQEEFSFLFIPTSLIRGLAGESAIGTVSTLPRNWETLDRKDPENINIEYDNIFDYLAPKRGGFLWPGTSQPQVRLQWPKLTNFSSKNINS